MKRGHWIIAAAALLFTRRANAATPEHPNHMVRPDRIQAAVTDDGKFLQVVNGKAQWSGGVLAPQFVWNASLNPAPAPGASAILRDATTGVLTLPSAPNPPQSLQVYLNGVRQVYGREFVVNGAVVTPGPDQTVNGVVYSPKSNFIAAWEIVADYAR